MENKLPPEYEQHPAGPLVFKEGDTYLYRNAQFVNITESSHERAFRAMREALEEAYAYEGPHDGGLVPVAVFAAMTPEQYRARWDFDGLDRAHRYAAALALAREVGEDA